MSTEPTPINRPTSAEPSQVTESTPVPQPVVPPTSSEPAQQKGSTPMAMISLTKQEAVGVLTSLLNGILAAPDTFQPQISVPLDRIKIAQAAV